MDLDEDATRRLAALGITSPEALAFWQHTRLRNGDESFQSLLDSAERNAMPTPASVAMYAEWFPRLQAFAARCRSSDPIPTIADLSAVDAAKYAMLLGQMRAFRTGAMSGGAFFPKPDVVRGVRTTRPGLTAAAETFVEADVMVMTSAEWELWRAEEKPTFGRRPYRSEIAWWVRLDDDNWEARRLPAPTLPPPAGCEDWIISIGSSRGPTTGGGHYERWRWDGTDLRFVENAGDWIS